MNKRLIVHQPRRNERRVYVKTRAFRFLLEYGIARVFDYIEFGLTSCSKASKRRFMFKPPQ